MTVYVDYIILTGHDEQKIEGIEEVLGTIFQNQRFRKFEILLKH